MITELSNSPGRRTLGFTLIELLIVSVILSVVSIAIFSSFSSGLKIWKRVDAGIPGEEVVLFFERFGAELRSAARLESGGFYGNDERVEFPVVEYSRRMDRRTPGRLVYSFKADAGSVTRSYQDYSALFTGREPEARPVLKGLEHAKFLFYCFDPKVKRYVWRDSWSEGVPPLAVRLELRFRGDAEREATVRTFNVPIARKL